MKKSIILFGLIVFTMVLSGCDKSEYIATEDQLNGNPIFIYYNPKDECPTWYTNSVEVDNTNYFVIMNDCPESYVVKVSDIYVDIIDYIQYSDVEVSDLEELSFGRITTKDSIEKTLGIDINDFVLVDINVKELNNQIITKPGWDGSETVMVSMDEIMDDIVGILSSPIDSQDVCDNSFCVVFGPWYPMTITFSNGVQTMYVNVQTTYVSIMVTEEDMKDMMLFNIRVPEENISHLYNTIYDRYELVNS